MLLLDTNHASAIIKRTHPPKKLSVDVSDMAISVITECELLWGLAKKPEAVTLKASVEQFLSKVSVLPINSATAPAYAEVRRSAWKGFGANRGSSANLSPFDMLIVAQAYQHTAILVTNDGAMKRFKTLVEIEDWLS